MSNLMHHPRSLTLRVVLAVGLIAVSAGGLAGCAASGETFASPEAGAEALVSALRRNDSARLEQVIGEDADSVLASGDAADDRARRDEFLGAYDRKHRVVAGDDGTATIVVGDGDWPMPIPMVRRGDGWRFDSERGKEEILARRIGRNELAAMQTCRAIVDAQREFRAATGRYASKITSDPGTHNGLHWPTNSGEAASPLGELVAAAECAGSAAKGSGAASPRPFHGYLYRLLPGQGPHAPGGARDYGKADGPESGFAVVAFPAAYGESGVMTFMVCKNGLIFERDLGSGTARECAGMRAFDPDGGWRVAREPK